MQKRIPKISFVFPIYNEESNLQMLYQKVKDACIEADVTYEMLFVDDGSSDNSLTVIKKLRERDAQIRYISFSRNFGHQNAIFAGMSHATGDAVVTMDADLQHPPSLISKMIALWKEGAEVVNTTKKEARLNFIEFCFFKAFYWIISKASGLKLEFGQSDFRLLDKKVLKIILQIPEYHKFLRGQVKWVGFTQRTLSYSANKRYTGKSKFSYRKRFAFALNGIFAFSRYPLHLMMLTGIFISTISLLNILFILFVWILNKLNIPNNLPLVPGWATITVGIFFLGSIQLISIGILGEYIGRIFDQIKGRPVFIIREMSDAEE